MRKLIAVAAVCVLLAAACGDDGDSGAGSENGGTATTGGSITIADKAEIPGLDPTQLTGSSSTGANQAFAIYDSLMRVDQDTGEVVPQLAESLETEDAKVWTLHLREGVNFSDGTPLDAEAVKFNWERHMDEELGSPNAGSVAQIELLTVVDPLTLEIELESPNGGFDALLVDRLAFIGSPTAIEEKGDDFSRNPVGAGPFLFESWVPDAEMVLVRNPDYWNAPLPHLDELHFRVIIDGSQREAALDAGEIDVARTTAQPDVARANEQGRAVAAWYSNMGACILLNNRMEPFDDPELRRAMVLAVDREQIRDVVLQGGGEPMTHLFAEGSPWRADDVALPDADAEEAQRIFDAYEAEHGEPLSFTLTVFQNIESRQLGEFIQAVLSDFGVQVSVEAGESGAVVSSIFEGAFVASHWSFPVGTDPEPLVYDSFHSESPANRVGYANPDVDAALELGRASLDRDERFEAYKEVQRHLVDDHPVLWMFHQVTAYILADHVADMELSGDGIVLSDRLTISE